MNAGEAKWSEYLLYDEAKAEAVLPMVERERQALAGAEARLHAAEDALAGIPEEVEHDRLLDFVVNLRAEIAGSVEGGRSVEQLNRTLGELFSAFTICRELPAETMPEEVESPVAADSAYVFPNLRLEVVMRLLAEYEPDEPEPALEWIEAFAKSADTQEPWHPQTHVLLSREGRPDCAITPPGASLEYPWVVTRDESGPRY